MLVLELRASGRPLDEDSEVIMTMPGGRRGVVKLLSIKGDDKAKIGFEFVREVEIHRRAIQAKIDATKETGGDAA